jgi:hypothetical protein
LSIQRIDQLLIFFECLWRFFQGFRCAFHRDIIPKNGTQRGEFMGEN